jgi:hypothetical protein
VPGGPEGAWYAGAELARSDGRLEQVTASFGDGRHPDGTLLRQYGPISLLATDPTAWAVARCTRSQGATDVVFVEVRASAAGGTLRDVPPLCYVLTRDVHAAPPAIALVAFADAARDGRVLPPEAARAAGIGPERQAAAVRWWPSTGEVHQVYVGQAWRRRRIATKLLVAADVVSVALGGLPLRGGSHRTDLGDHMLSRAPEHWQVRLQERTATAPPMTPPDGEPPRG